MPEITTDLNGVTGTADERLAHYVNRIARLEEMKAEAMEEFTADIKEVKAELKAAGYDTKLAAEMVKLARMEAIDREEREMIRDTYRRAVFGLGSIPKKAEGESLEGFQVEGGADA